MAVPTGAQKWLREPASDHASVERCRPAATSRRSASAPNFSITAVALKCMVTTIAVEGHACAMRSTTCEASASPSPMPPTSVALVRPSNPASPSARIAVRGNMPSRSTAMAAGSMMSRMMVSSFARYVMTALYKNKMGAAGTCKRKTDMTISPHVFYGRKKLHHSNDRVGRTSLGSADLHTGSALIRHFQSHPIRVSYTIGPSDLMHIKVNSVTANQRETGTKAARSLAEWVPPNEIPQLSRHLGWAA